MFTEKFRPRTLEEYGYNTTSALCKNYVESCLNGAPMARAVLLHGPPGGGKSTLVRCLARHFGAPVVETNASLELTKDTFRGIINSMLSRPLSGDVKVFFLDEIDALSTKQQKLVVDMLGKGKDPVFFACNNFSDITKELKEACFTVKVERPSERELRQLGQRVCAETGVPQTRLNEYVAKARSYRELLTLLESGGETGEGDVHVDDTQERIKRFLRGEESYLRPSEFWGVGAWVVDNTKGTEAATWDLWRERYYLHGKPMEKYLLTSLRGLKVEDPQFPWSVFVRVESDKPKAKKERKGRGKKSAETPENTPVGNAEKTAAQTPPVAPKTPENPVVSVDDFF